MSAWFALWSDTVQSTRPLDPGIHLYGRKQVVVCKLYAVEIKNSLPHKTGSGRIAMLQQI